MGRARAQPQAMVTVLTAAYECGPPEQIQQAVDICPVGTILHKGVGYDQPIGRRRYDVESVRDRALDAARGTDR